MTKYQEYWRTIIGAAEAMSKVCPGLPPPVEIVKLVSRPKKKPAAGSSRLKPFWPKTREAAFEWLTANGCPEKGDGGQARLEAYVADWLAARGYSAGKSTLRGHVRSWIAEFRATL